MNRSIVLHVKEGAQGSMDRKKEAANKETHDDRLLLAESSLKISRISPREKVDDTRLTKESPSVAVAQASKALSGSSKKSAPEGSTSKRACAPPTAKTWEKGLARVVNPTDYDVLFGRSNWVAIFGLPEACLYAVAPIAVVLAVESLLSQAHVFALVCRPGQAVPGTSRES
jgi:hypothetical protein